MFDHVMTEAEVKAKHRVRMIGGALRYAAADRTDPFAFRRAMAHIDNGVASMGRPENKEYAIAAGSRAMYDAAMVMEPRSYVRDGETINYDVVRWQNMKRP